MREPYWHDETATLYIGSAREVLAEMPDGSVDCIITSPPPWTPPQDTVPEHAGRYGHEPTPALYIAALRRVFAEAHRVLAEEGTVWLVTADRYAGQTGSAGPSIGSHSRVIRDQAMTGLPVASLIGLPWQLAFALHDDGWSIRNAIVWRQPTGAGELGPLPEDRFATSYELIFLLVKQSRYHFDPEGIRWPSDGSHGAGRRPATGGSRQAAHRLAAVRRRHGRIARRGSGNQVNAVGNCRHRHDAAMPNREWHSAAPSSGTHPGDVWVVPARPSPDTLPIEVPLCCIAAGCRPGGTVLDMFAGTAITGLAARALGRSFIGVTETETLGRSAERRLRRTSGGA